MAEVAPTDGLSPITLESFASPIEAFDTVAGKLLTEAADLGVLNFAVNDLGMIDAVNALNTVGKYIDEHPEEPITGRWHEMFEVIGAAYETDVHKDMFSFGIEAVLRDGVVGIWRPQ